MFGNTIQLLKNTANWKLVNRIGDANNQGSNYRLREDTGETTMAIRHTTYVDKTNTNRKGMLVERHNVEIVQRVFGDNVTADIVRKAYVIIENDRGDALANPQDVAGALQEFLTDANVLSILNGES